MIGDTVSKYRILEKIGEGGMGTVYKAEDSSLDRIVALKILPPHSIGKSTAKARFLREAKAAAKLNHPNITHIYEVDETRNGQPFIAMEYIEGETLASLIGKGPLSISQAVDIMIQATEALKVAHEHDILHRDIKSNNIMLASGGKVKIMDFGLARIEGASTLTKDGHMLGTLPYMSPEQARAEQVDQRSDIWSLGVVFYEMLTGQLPFRGEYDEVIGYAIMNQDPDPPTAVRSGIPIALDGIIKKALAKNKEHRYQHVDEFGADLKSYQFKTVISPGLFDRLNKLNRWGALGVILGLIFIGVISGYLFQYLFTSTQNTGSKVQRYNITLPESAPIAPVGSANLGIGQRALAISPDGNYLVYVADIDGQTQLFKKNLNAFNITPIPDTQGAFYPFFSPDGKWIGFFSNNKLKKIAIDGSQAISLCNAVYPAGAAWTKDNRIIFTTHEALDLFWIPSEGGTPSRIIDSIASSRLYQYPQLLPDGNHIITSPMTGGMVILNLEDGSQEFIDIEGNNFSYIPDGFLVYFRDDHLEAVQFNTKDFSISSKPVPILSNVGIMPITRDKQWTVSDTGLLIYLPSSIGAGSEPVWKYRNGNIEATGLPLDFYSKLSLSPDNTRLAIDTFSEISGWQTWIYDLAQKTGFKIPIEGEVRYPVWSMDGDWIALLFLPSKSQIYSVLWSIGNKKNIRYLKNINTRIDSFDPKRNNLVVKINKDIKIIDIDSLTIKEIYGEPSYNDWGATMSPDGKWIAYSSDEQDIYNVYVEPFPKTGERWKVSTDGGEEPRWSGQTNELFYRSGRRWYSVSYQANSVFNFDSPELLFEGDFLNVPGHSYEVSNDGQRFLLLRQPAEEFDNRTLNVVTNWFEELESKFN